MIAFTKPAIAASVLLGAAVLFGLYLLLWLRYNGQPVPVPVIDRQPAQIGQGAPLTFAVMGDSTSVSQGSSYDDGYAVAAAQYLARTHTVTWRNAGVSGARAHDVLSKQLPDIVVTKPDVVLIGVGANDVTHISSPSTVVADLRATIAALQKANPRVLIVMTGAPDMGSPPRLPQPLRWLAGTRTIALNKELLGLIDSKHVWWAPIAQRTGPAFRADHSLFAADKFHPNTRGYALWSPVVIDTLRRAGY